jgi:hypothetical protein
MAFVVHGTNPEAYLGLIRTTAKTVIQTGQLGAIFLADALVVQLYLALQTVVRLILLHSKVYRTWVVWNHNFYVIVIPCLTFVATFGKFLGFYSAGVAL